MSDKKMTVIALDCMGGDFAPAEQVKGACMAVNAGENIKVILFGDEALVKAELSKYTYDNNRISIVPSFSVIDNCESPAQAIRQKKDSSMVLGMKAVRDKEADAFVSCGSTGAMVVGGQTIIGRAYGIKRAALAFLVPSLKNPVLILDCGANADTKAEALVQFALMGSVYMKSCLGLENARVGILNNGEEESKGNAVVKEAFPLLKNCRGINFIGSVESRGITEGLADVCVCEGFVGNAILKMYEGVAGTILTVMKEAMTKNIKTKLGAFLIKNDLKDSLKQFSIEEYGGAPLLGLKSLVVKPHGSSKAVEIKNAILQCEKAIETDMAAKIEEILKENPEVLNNGI